MKKNIIILTSVMALIGAMTNSIWLIALATSIFGFGFVISDFRNIQLKAVNALSFFALGTGFVGLGNMMLASDFTSGMLRYVGYGIPWYYKEAAILSFIGAVFPHLGGLVANRLCIGHKNGSLLPPVRFIPARSNTFPWIVLAFAVICFFVTTGGVKLPHLGRVTTLLSDTPVLAVFFLARWGYRKNNYTLIWVTLAFSAIISYHAFLYSILRSMILLPWMAFIIGAVLGGQSLRTLKSPAITVVYTITAIFFLYFGLLGIVRGERIYGKKRITRLHELRSALESGSLDSSLQSPLVRKASLKKQSNIFHLVGRNGYYYGESMSYYLYVFIPRFIWPDKPVIAKGQWFARQLGRGTELRGGRYSNAINMTIPGELYLNFGWTGVVLGCTGVGFILMLIWNASGFWGTVDNLTGTFLSFRLIYRAIDNLGPDMQSLIGYINTYILLLVIGYICRILFSDDSENHKTALSVSNDRYLRNKI